MVSLTDSKVLVGIGIGLIIGSLLVSAANLSNRSMSRSQIEQKARGYGMDYPNDFKVINKEVKK